MLNILLYYNIALYLENKLDYPVKNNLFVKFLAYNLLLLIFALLDPSEFFFNK